MGRPITRQNKQHILVKKTWAGTDLEFFPGSNMLYTGSNAPLGCPKFWARKLYCPYIFVTRFLLTSLPYCVEPSTPKKDTSWHMTYTCRVGSRDISVSGHSVHVHKTSEPQFSFVIYYKECICLVIRRLLSTFLFIYLFIEFSKSHSITLQELVCLSPCCSVYTGGFIWKSPFHNVTRKFIFFRKWQAYLYLFT